MYSRLLPPFDDRVGDKLYVGTLYGTLLVYSVREPLGMLKAWKEIMTTVQGFNYPCWSTLHTDTLRFCLLLLFDTGQDEAISVTLMETLKTFSKKAIEQIDLIKAVG